MKGLYPETRNAKHIKLMISLLVVSFANCPFFLWTLEDLIHQGYQST